MAPAAPRKPDEREWQARKHGPQGRRQWREVQLAMDPATSDIRAVEFTPSRDGDGPVLPDLLDQIPENEAIGTVTADGPTTLTACHTAIITRDAQAIIPIRKNGRLWKEDCPAARARNETLRATRHYGRASRKRWTGYHTRSRIEARMRCLKAFGWETHVSGRCSATTLGRDVPAKYIRSLDIEPVSTSGPSSEE